MSIENDPVKTRQTIQKKIMDLIARRDHSEQELRTKLAEKFSGEENVAELIDEAIHLAQKNNWLANPSTLAERVAEDLHRRNKGIEYINGYLQEKGLPSIDINRDQELAKAMAVVRSKFAEDYNFSQEDKAKVGRLLTSRGFDSDTVGKVIYEKL